MAEDIALADAPEAPPDLPNMLADKPSLDDAGEAAAARERSAIKLARGVTHDTPHPLKPLPRVSSRQEAEALAPGSDFIDPEGNTRTVPYRVRTPQDVQALPEGVDFIGPDNQLRQKPKYQDIDFTSQTLFNMAVNDKERTKALERSYPGKVKRMEGVEGPESFWVDDEGAPRRPRGFSKSPGAYLAAEAAPVLGSVAGEIAGGIGGSAIAPGVGTVAGAVALSGVGGGLGQGFNDVILQLAGVYDRTGGEEAAALGTATALGSAGSAVGRGISAIAPSIKGAIQTALPRLTAEFLGADAKALETAIAIREKGAPLVPPSGWAKEAPHLQNIVEVLDPAFRTQRPLVQSATQHYETQAGQLLKDLGFKAEGDLLDPTAAVSSLKAGQAVRARTLEESAAADARLNELLEASRAGVQAGLPARIEEQQAVTRAATEARQAADALVNRGFQDIEQTANNAMRLSQAGTNTGDLWQMVGDQLRAVRQGIQARAEQMYGQADVAAGAHLPNAAGLPETARAFLQEVPPDFANRYPTIVQRLRNLAGEPELDAAGNQVGWIREPHDPTFGELHNIRSMLRDGADWFALSSDVKNGTFKFFARQVDNILHDVNAVPELRTAAGLLREADTFYRENMGIFNAKNLKTVMDGLRAGEPADPKVLYNALIKEGHTDLTNRVLGMLDPRTANAVRAADVQEMLAASQSYVPGQVDGVKFAREVLDRRRANMLHAIHGEQVGDTLLTQAQRVMALNGKVDLPVRPGDTARDIIRNARVAGEAAKEAASTDPIKALGQEMKMVQREHAQRVKQMQAERKNDPLGFLYEPTVGAHEAAERILKSEDMLLAAAMKFGPTSPEFEMLRQVWVTRILQGSMDVGSKLAKVSPEIQNLMFPGVSLDTMKTLAKEMDFLLSTKGAGQGTGKSIMATERVEHPWAAIPLGRGVGKVVPMVDAAGRGMLGKYYKTVTELTSNLPFLRWIEKGLKGDEAARQMTREAVQRAMQKGGAVGAAVGEIAGAP